MTTRTALNRKYWWAVALISWVAGCFLVLLPASSAYPGWAIARPLMLVLLLFVSGGAAFRAWTETEREADADLDVLSRARSLAAEPSAHMLKTVLNSILDSVYVKDPDGRCLFINNAGCYFMSLPRDRILGRTEFDLLSEPLAVETRAIDVKILASGKASTYEHRKTLGGVTRDYLTTKVPYRDSGGNVLGIIGVSRDVTEHRKATKELETLTQTLESRVAERSAAAEARARELAESRNALERMATDLAHSNQELQRFAYLASHDLAEPLRMISSYLTLLSRRYQGKLGPEADEFIRFAVDGAQRMKGLLDQVLLYSRIGTHVWKLAKVDSDQLVRSALASYGAEIEAAGAEVELGELPEVVADGHHLEQVFENLIDNAIKFRSSRSLRLRLGAERLSDEWRFSVADNGIGFEPEHAARIFEIFQRLHGRSEYSGNGVGLAVCRRVIERHGGKIWAESEPDGGATIYFTLPAVKSTP